MRRLFALAATFAGAMLLALPAGVRAEGIISAVSVTPSTISGGSSATGTVAFTGPMPDAANVQLSSSNPAAASVPAETVVSANASSGTFNVSTTVVTANTTVTITANWFSVTK